MGTVGTISSVDIPKSSQGGLSKRQRVRVSAELTGYTSAANCWLRVNLSVCPVAC